MKQAKCHTCDKVTHNLLTANCNHKICFNCVKNNRNNHKCSSCVMSGSKTKIQALSPARKHALDKQRQRTTKTKSIQSHRHQESSPFVQRSFRKSQLHIQSCSNYLQASTVEDPRIQIRLLCKQHHQPLTLFSKSSKQAICSTCLCSKPKYKEEIMPIKNAEDFLRKENHLQRQESRVILNDIQKCHRLMKVNFEQFQTYYTSHSKIVSEIFTQLHKQLEQQQRQVKHKIDQFFVKKLKQCQEIQQDLAYLIQTLQTYRQENRDSNTLTQSLYVYSSFKVIKKTMKTLNLDYISYANRNVNLLEYNKGKFDQAVYGLLRFHQDLPLKHEQMESQTKRRGNSASVSRQKPTGYSHKKQSIYQNLLNDRINLKHDQQRKSISRTLESAKKKIQHLHQPQPPTKTHNNSLSAYIHQNLEKQRPHNNSASSYLNSRSDHKQSVSSSAFDYELRTPIKQILTYNNDYQKSSSKNNNRTPEYGQGSGKQSIEKSRKTQFNLISASSISGLDMNEEEKSLYKRLLKSRFMKGSQQQKEQQAYGKVGLQEENSEDRDGSQGRD